MRILDIGWTFGLSAGRTFDPWDVESVHIHTLNQAKEEIPKADLIVFGGGQDVHPKLYGHPNVGSYVGNNPGTRDNFEQIVFEIASKQGKPLFGICRGAQFLCAMAGGTLVQDVTNHSGTHMITTSDGREIAMTSAHHQMMWPGATEHELLAWTSQRRSRHYKWAGGDISINKEPEVVWFPKIKALGVQGHPEFFPNPYEPGVVYTRELVNKYLLKGEMPNV